MLLWLIYVLIAIIIIVILLRFLFNVLFVVPYGTHDIANDVIVAKSLIGSL